MKPSAGRTWVGGGRNRSSIADAALPDRDRAVFLVSDRTPQGCGATGSAAVCRAEGRRFNPGAGRRSFDPSRIPHEKVTTVSYTLLPGTRAPVRVWTDPYGIEPQAAQQLRNIGSLPWVDGVAVMPDVHYGKGATVGSVIAMRQAISPAAVGVDIGCGMSAVRTSLTADNLPDDLGPLRAAIEDTIPVGFAQRDGDVNIRRIRRLEQGGWDTFWRSFGELTAAVGRLDGRAHNQMGTLGGGNHFIEVCVEQDGGPDAGQVWLMLHSGSRNIGKELAERHMAVARDLPHNADLPDRDLAVFL